MLLLVRSGWAIAAVIVLASPVAVGAQTNILVQGRVIAVAGSEDIEGARVELEGHGATETTAAGMFRFEGVHPGDYSLRVSAVGYLPATLRLTIRGDTTVTVRLEAVPFRLDSLVVTARRIDVEGMVQDTVRDLLLRDADIYTSYVLPTRTNRLGRFRLEGVWEHNPIAVTVAAYGYLPLDTILIPTAGDRYVFTLTRDLVVERMIGQQIERIEHRAAGHLSALMRPLNRDALLQSGGGSLRDILQARYSIHLRRLRCILLDDRQLPASVDGAILGTINPEDVERIEFLFNGAMLRVYTREFVRRMIGRSDELRKPVYVGITNRPVCH